MPTLQSIAELTWRSMFPKPTDEVKVRKEQVIADAKSEYAYQMWVKQKAEKRESGEDFISSHLLTEVELEVINNEIDISGLKILRGLDYENWLQNVGGYGCACKYVKTSHNLVQALCEDDSLGDSRRVFPLGKKLKFPDGTHSKKLSITYVNGGESIDGMIEIDDVMAGIIRRSLYELYQQKIGQADVTNNTNPEN